MIPDRWSAESENFAANWLLPYEISNQVIGSVPAAGNVTSSFIRPRWLTTAIAQTHERAAHKTAGACAQAFNSFTEPKSAQSIVPTSGKSGMARSRMAGSNILSLLCPRGLDAGRRQLRERFLLRFDRQRFGIASFVDARLAQCLPQADVKRALAAIERQEERQCDPRLAGGYGDDEEREHLPVQVAVMATKGDEVDRHPLEHQLCRQEHQNQVSPRQKADEPEREQDGADGEIVRKADHARPPSRRRAMAMAPIVATRSSVPASSTASRWSLKSVRPIAETL